MSKGVEMQRRHASDKLDLVGFKSRPTPPSFLTRQVPAIILWCGLISTMLGALYLIQGATLPGFSLVIIGALFAKAAHEA